MPHTTHTPEEEMTAFLEMRAAHVREWHDHKETMAHAALLVSLTLTVGVITACPWPPSWVGNLWVFQGHITSAWIFAVIMVLLLWLCIHVYMRWQLRNRRIAACLYGTLLTVLLDWIRNPPSAADIKPDDRKIPKVGILIKLWDLFILPSRRANYGFDKTLAQYPKPVVRQYLDWKTDAFIAEVIVSIGNIVLGAIIVFAALAEHGNCQP